MLTTTGIVLITTAALLAGCDACGSRGLYCTAPADNCAEVFCDANRESGHYWVKRAGGSSAERVYCARDHPDCGEGNWMRVARIDTTERFFTCPGGSEPMVVNKKQYCRTPTAGVHPSISTPWDTLTGRCVGSSGDTSTTLQMLLDLLHLAD